MSADFTICPMSLRDCRRGLFRRFIRHSEDMQVWKYASGAGILVEEAFLRDWDRAKRRRMEESLRQNLRQGSAAFAAWKGRRLAGYCILKPQPLGSRGQYLLLHCLQISKQYRGFGLGKRLFRLACGEARARGAEKLCISSSPSADTVAFYRRMGCTEAAERIPSLLEAEPEDYQMEFDLLDVH